VDALEAIFSGGRVEQAVYGHVEARSPWGINFREGPGARFGLLVRGGCHLRLNQTQESASLVAGDCFVIAHGHRYQLLDALNSRTVDCYSLFRDTLGQTVRTGGDGAETTIISGWFLFDQSRARHLLELLPALIHVRVDRDRSAMLQAALHLLAMETADNALGKGLVVSRLADIIFLHAVRAHVTQMGEGSRGVLAALKDPQILRALTAIHADLARAWTVQSLAREIGMSRSALAQRFTDRVGEAPLEYVRRWRMQRATECLRAGERSIGEIAALVGYGSEAAFSNSFLRVVGVRPGTYRKSFEMEASAG
jgi:AraC-like DNA-binding protein